MPWLQRVARWPWTASSRFVDIVGDFAQRTRGAARHHTRPIVIPETQELLAPVPAVLTPVRTRNSSHGDWVHTVFQPRGRHADSPRAVRGVHVHSCPVTCTSGHVMRDEVCTMPI